VTVKYNSRFCAAILVFFLFCNVAGAQEANWTSFSSPDGKYSILMPGPGVEETVERKTNAGIAYDNRFATLVMNDLGVMTLAGCTEYESSYVMKIEAELRANTDNFIKGMKATQLSSRRAGFQRAPGDMLPSMEFTAESADYYMKGLFLLIGQRACGAIFVYRKGQDRSMMMEKFISSLEIRR
jgi:hypothetical protein